MNPMKHVNHKALTTTLLSFLRRNNLKAGNRLLSGPTPQPISMAERKRLVEEGNGYLREASDLINGNRTQLSPDAWASLDRRWSELYTRVPKPGKLTRGRLDPEDFCQQSRALLHDAQEALELLHTVSGDGDSDVTAKGPKTPKGVPEAASAESLPTPVEEVLKRSLSTRERELSKSKEKHHKEHRDEHHEHPPRNRDPDREGERSRAAPASSSSKGHKESRDRGHERDRRGESSRTKPRKYSRERDYERRDRDDDRRRDYDHGRSGRSSRRHRDRDYDYDYERDRRDASGKASKSHRDREPGSPKPHKDRGREDSHRHERDAPSKPHKHHDYNEQDAPSSSSKTHRDDHERAGKNPSSSTTHLDADPPADPVETQKEEGERRREKDKYKYDESGRRYRSDRRHRSTSDRRRSRSRDRDRDRYQDRTSRRTRRRDDEGRRHDDYYDDDDRRERERRHRHRGGPKHPDVGTYNDGDDRTQKEILDDNYYGSRRRKHSRSRSRHRTRKRSTSRSLDRRDGDGGEDREHHRSRRHRDKHRPRDDHDTSHDVDTPRHLPDEGPLSPPPPLTDVLNPMTTLRDTIPRAAGVPSIAVSSSPTYVPYPATLDNEPISHPGSPPSRRDRSRSVLPPQSHRHHEPRRHDKRYIRSPERRASAESMAPLPVPPPPPRSGEEPRSRFVEILRSENSNY